LLHHGHVPFHTKKNDLFLVVANVFLISGAFAVLWILEFARTVQLRPNLVTADALLVRGGMQWALDVPRSTIESVVPG
jgi:hypothetical protein